MQRKQVQRKQVQRKHVQDRGEELRQGEQSSRGAEAREASKQRLEHKLAAPPTPQNAAAHIGFVTGLGLLAGV